MDRDKFYSVPEVARLIGISQTRVRQLIKQEELEAERDEKGWLVAKHAVHAFRENYTPKRTGQEAHTLPKEVVDAYERAESLQRELGRLEGRLELEAVARSTLEEQLLREQVLRDQERERAEQERQERIQVQEAAKELTASLDSLEEENQKLREVLQAEQSKGFWQRLFGKE